MMYQVGAPFPIYPLHPGAEYCIAIPETRMLEVFVYLKDTESANVSAFNRSPFSFGLFEYKHIPIFLLDMPEVGVSIQILVNAFLVESGKRADFLGSPIHNMAILLINTDTNILKVIRFIKLSSVFGTSLHDMCTRQLMTYSSSDDVNPIYLKLIEEMSFEEMVEKGVMVSSAK